MSQINDGGPAFPMTLRQYAAIKLAVPDSGLPWLDDMIVQSNRQRLAGQALAGLLTQPAETEFGADHFAKASYEIADATLVRCSNDSRDFL